MSNSDYGIPDDVLRRASENAERALRYPESLARQQLEREHDEPPRSK